MDNRKSVEDYEIMRILKSDALANHGAAGQQPTNVRDAYVIKGVKAAASETARYQGGA
jgi:hypothetical protein